ncbi:Homing endonuclease [uncultured virus]|nr:Homing endonuclease [uncultured virus]
MDVTLEVIGIISSVATDGTSYKVKVTDSNRQSVIHTVKHDEKYFPIRQGDCFRGFLVPQTDGTSRTLGKPLITTGIDGDTVKGYFMSFLGKSVPFRVILQIYKNLEDNVGYLQKPEVTTVSAYVSYLAEQWTSSGSEIALEALAPLTKQQAVTFLSRWRASHDMRLLYLLGLTKKEIYTCDIAIATLYKILCDNPYTVGAVSLEKAKLIDQMTGRNPESTDVRCGEILRAVHLNSTSKCWTCTKEKSLLMKFRDLFIHKKRLIETFGLVWDDVMINREPVTMIYIKLHYEAEVYVANKLAELVKAPLINQNVLIDFQGTSLDPEQQEAIRMALSNNVSIVTAHAGCGKCLAAGTRILMFDGTIKRVEDVKIGDQLMGDDSQPRQVLSTCSGEDEMYKVTPSKGEAYTVNSVHVLTLQSSSNPIINYQEGLDIHQVTWINSEGEKNARYFGGKNGWSFATAFVKSLPKDEFIDIPLDQYLKKSVRWMNHWKGYQVGVEFSPSTPVSFDPTDVKWSTIPHEFKTAPRETRMEILKYFLSVEIKSETLKNDLVFIARSCGLEAKLHNSQLIIGESTLRSDLEIEAVGRGRYYGFTLDGNGRFLLGDFTVTHNTYSITQVERLLDVSKINWCATSFTGKAVSRIKQVTGNSNAATMNRMIARPHAYQDFKHLIIDEASMVPVLLMYRFFRTFRHPYAITYVGDITQLPPIGWGSLMKECMMSRTIPLTWLKTNHRVRTKDGHLDCIIANSTRIARWRDEIPYNFITGPNFVTTNCEPSYLIQKIAEFKAAGLNQDQFMVISPYNDGLDEINMAAQLLFHGYEKFVIGSNGGTWALGDRLTRPPLGKNKEEKCWYVGDKIMMIQNNYDIDVMNGEEGVILDVDIDKITAKFEEKIVEIPLAKNSRVKKQHSEHVVDEDADNNLDTRDIALSYAITVHKSQGSQWNIVIGYIKAGGDSHKGFLNKNLFYTLQTRTVEKFILLGSIVTASKAIANPLPYRCECLKNRLNNLLPYLFDEIIDDALAEELAAKAVAPKRQYKDFELPSDDEDDEY